jgi:predicted ABC-type ATPase
MEKVLYLIAGANGSGKTTIARELLSEEKLEFLNADEIAAKLDPDITKVRVSKGGHTVPDVDVLRRYLRGRRNFFDIVNSKLIDKWTLYYNGDETYSSVAQGKPDFIDISNQDLYNKFIGATKNG